MSELEKDAEIAVPKKHGPRAGSRPAGGGAEPETRSMAPNKPAAKKKAPARRAPARKKPAAAARAVTAPRPISAEERMRLISEAAYYKAEARGFCGGNPEGDWLEAEAEIDAMLLQERPGKE